MSFIKDTAYTLLEWINFGKGVKRTINGMEIRFPARWSRYYQDTYEEENYAMLEKEIKPGMHIMDIGAHIGLFSVTCSKLTGPSGKVWSFEPTPGTYTILKKTLQINGCDNVKPIEAAVSDHEGKATFFISDTSADNANSLVSNNNEKERKGYDVKLVSIDSILSTGELRPSIIKIDAEGAELDVLKGAGKTFKELKPKLILGLHPSFVTKKGDSLAEIWDILEQNQYRVELDGKTITKADFISREGSREVFDVHCY